MFKKILSHRFFMFFGCLLVFAGTCSRVHATSHADALSQDSSCMQTDIHALKLPANVKVAGLGEASHGVKEYHLMKADVFKALVQNNECRTFIIEGDFGGSLKVDQYIHGGSGTAMDAVKEIGFAIYDTQEMADLVQWMRDYNEKAVTGKDLHFYGMDIQRFDNNKAYLFSVLKKSVPELSTKYEAAFASLTDETCNTLTPDVLKSSKDSALNLEKEMENSKDKIIAKVGDTGFEFARECAHTIYTYCNLLLNNDRSYNQLRDQAMYEKVEWFLQHGDGSMLFINGHNGHIARKSFTFYTNLGQLLSKNLGGDYFAIGTDAMTTTFNSQDDNGKFTVEEVNNASALTTQAAFVKDDFYYIDFSQASQHPDWEKIISASQSVTSLNVGISSFQKLIKSFYTANIIPKQTFDGMIIFKKVSPTTLLK